MARCLILKGMNNINFVGALMLWIHISSAVVLIGGAIYAKAVAIPAEAFRSRITVAIGGILISGIYNLMQRGSGLSSEFLTLFAVKMLLALHVFAVGFLLGKPGVDEGKRKRWATGVMYSGMFVIALSVCLRYV